MVTKCAILGASGHGKVVAEIAELNGYSEVHFFDEQWPKLRHQMHWNIVGNTSSLLNLTGEYDLIIVAIGDNTTRLAKQRELQDAGGAFKALVHPSASVSLYSNLGLGTVVMANAVISPFASIGESCIINTSATIDHDCTISDGVHISPGANLAGTVKVGEKAWVGIGAQIKQLINIGEGAVIGAGATVVKNVAHQDVVTGTPAKTNL